MKINSLTRRYSVFVILVLIYSGAALVARAAGY